jgi:hypothetical protein
MSLTDRYRNTLTFLLSWQELCSYVNSSSNFFIYYVMGSRYKETLWQFLGRKQRRGSAKCLASEIENKSNDVGVATVTSVVAASVSEAM